MALDPGLLENITKLYLNILIGFIIGLVLFLIDKKRNADIINKADYRGSLIDSENNNNNNNNKNNDKNTIDKNKSISIRERFSKLTTDIIIKIFTPIIILLTLTTSEFELSLNSVFIIILLELISVFTAWIFTYYYFMWRKMDKRKLGALMFLNGFPNVLIYSIPIVLSLFDEILIIIPTVFASAALIVRGIFSNIIAEKLDAFDDGKKSSALESLKRLIMFPPLIGIIVGVILVVLNIPLPLETLRSMKSTISPWYSGLGGLIIGVILSKLTLKEVKKNLFDILKVAIWRFGAAFLIFILCLGFLNFPQSQTEIRTILLINVIGPPAVINVAFSLYYKFDDKFAAACVASLTLIALIILPGIIAFGVRYF